MSEWFDSFITSKSAINYVIAAEGGLLSSIFIIYLSKFKGRAIPPKTLEYILLAVVVPIELLAWTPLVVLLALLLDNSPIISLLVGLAHEQIWTALQKSFDRIALMIVKLVVGKVPLPPVTPDEPPPAKPSTLPPVTEILAEAEKVKLA